ncbi:uncharacterized protein TNCT_218511 [Trichonephila clavata]|uniref:Uncharacterized protein n=1 Tax=Trichonephila clavata TaxID=2740835 RepID=A0A8X6I855_TRICU|nr:uncharacterized protein TNCT_218511 [Trichonephila clavata]
MLVQIDHATRYVIATPSASLAAHTVTDALYNNIILTATSIIERANGIIVATLKKAIDKNPNKGDKLLPNTLLAINTTKQNSTRKSPFLLHGYEPRLPCELHIGSFIDDTPREDQLDLLTLAKAKAAYNVYETHLQNKQRFDVHRRSYSFKVGDLVLYDWLKKDHKLSSIFKGPFVIVCPPGAVCYEIKSTTQQNKSRLSTYNIFALTLNEIQQPSRKTAQTKRMRATEPLPKNINCALFLKDLNYYSSKFWFFLRFN